MRLLVFLLLLAILSPLQAQTVKVSAWEKIVPSAQMPDSVKIMRGNNNLDLCFFKGSYYLAFRTAPTHFASRRTRIHVLRSEDRVHWQHEHTVSMRSDLREPRFVVYHGYLFLYYFQGGKSPFGFDPQHVFATQRQRDGSWKTDQLPNLDGYVPWRLRAGKDMLYMSAYYGKGLYTNAHKADLRLFTSRDGWLWQPISKHPQVAGQGGEEGEFIFDENGNLWGTVRVEGGGAMIVYAHRDSLAKWHLFPTKDKYDSALLFREGEDIFLVSRRNIDGAADKGKRLPQGIGRYYNMVRYSLTPKVTAIWRLDKENMRLNHLMDLPSTGDTAFPGIVSLGDKKWWLMNYSSDINGPTKSWIRGQLGKTCIYAAELTVE